MTGSYTETGLNLNVNPTSPTLFEYYRKHSDPNKSALNAWWLSEALGPYPSLNYSSHADYGPGYGANYLNAITSIVGDAGTVLAGLQARQPDDVRAVDEVRNFLDKSFFASAPESAGIVNTGEDREKLYNFITDTARLTRSGNMEWPLPTGVGLDQLSTDLVNVAYGWQVLKKFTPELLVLNTFDSDVCHSDFSGYLRFLHKADYGVGWLWNKIQSHPVLANDTIMICMPEHGRNGTPNNITDRNGFKAFDHTSDANSRRVFSLIVGPPSMVKQGQVLGSETSPVGESIDVLPTIAHILGFLPDIPAGMLNGKPMMQAFA